MKKIVYLLIALFMSTITDAQQKPAMPDINKMMKMNPQELEAYKQQLLKKNSQQVKAIAAQYNFKIDEMELPDFVLKPPKKDIKRLALLPIKPPSLIELSDALRQSKKEIENVATPAIKEEVKTITATQTAAQQQSSAVAAFYSDQPVSALLIAIHSVLQNTSEPAAWNNLAALFNMSGLEQKAIPILMNQLEKLPGNSMLLNNMGQAYLGLGDLNNAEMFLQQCLLQDPMNPEANHSMGIMKIFANEIDEGMKYFEKELEIGYRRSTLALIKSKNKVTNIYKLRKKRTNLPKKNFFGEIQLGKFRVPEFPESMDDTKAALDKHASFRESVTGEILYWLERGNATPAILKEEGKHEGVYSAMVEVLLHDLHEVYTPYELSLLNDIQFNQIKQLIDNYHEQINAIKCETAPANATMEVTIALQKKCCERRRAVIDGFMAQYNAFISMRINSVAPIWKEYLNDFVNIVSLDPSSANKRLACHAVYQYFLFLSMASTSGQFIDKECAINMTPAEADSILISARDIDLRYPPWLNISFDLGVAKIKADCSKYGIEGGALLQGSYDHDFKTGSSTLALGVGVKAKFFDVFGSAGVKQMVYLTIDNNNSFSDFGLKGGAGISVGGNPLPIDVLGETIKIGGTLAGVDAGYTLGFNSGFNSSVKGKGVLSGLINLK